MGNRHQETGVVHKHKEMGGSRHNQARAVQIHKEMEGTGVNMWGLSRNIRRWEQV